MSNYQEKPGTGALFQNNQKKADNHPDLSGTFTTPDGKRWSVSGWRKTTSKGDEMLSLSVKEFVQK